jgi:hypothetical protein
MDIAPYGDTHQISVIALLWDGIKWVVGGLFGIVFSVFGFILNRSVKQNDSRLDVVEQDFVDLRAKHEEDIKGFMTHCASVHEVEGRRASDYATKGDITDLRKEMQQGFTNVNNNILSIAQRGQ